MAPSCFHRPCTVCVSHEAAQTFLEVGQASPPAMSPGQGCHRYTAMEAGFRTGKSDLHLRQVFHQKTKRVEAHILVSFLSPALWRTLEQWMRAKGLGDCTRQLLLELDELRSMDVILPTRPAGEIRLRVVARPEKALAQLLEHLGLDLPRTPKILENVVPKTAT